MPLSNGPFSCEMASSRILDSSVLATGVVVEPYLKGDLALTQRNSLFLFYEGTGE